MTISQKSPARRPYRRVRVDCRVRAHFYGDEHGTFELRTALQKENRPRAARDFARRRQQRDFLRKGA